MTVSTVPDSTGMSGRVREHKWFTPWLLVAPATLWLCVFNLYPALNTVYMAFTDKKPLSFKVMISKASWRSPTVPIA